MSLLDIGFCLNNNFVLLTRTMTLSKSKPMAKYTWTVEACFLLPCKDYSVVYLYQATISKA